MSCDEARSLFESYIAALEAFHRAQEPLATGIPDDANLSLTHLARQNAFAVLTRARGKYWKHAQMHGCRTALGRSNPEIRSRLQNDLSEAKQALRVASEEFSRLVRISADCIAISYADGKIALDQARVVYASSFQQYREALSRFTNYLVNGEPSPET